MNMPDALVKQHLIDPELCIRCNSCEEHCPTGAISNNGINYVVEASTCNGCRDCVPDCPTGAIDNWWPVLKSAMHPVEAQFTWESLPAPAVAQAGNVLAAEPSSEPAVSVGRGAPASAATPVENRYTREHPLRATVIESQSLLTGTSSTEIRHIVLDVDADFPFLEGQSVGVIPPGLDANGRRHVMRLYSIASARGGESDHAGTLALTIKRVCEDPDGKPHHGICSNHMCDLRGGDTVEIVGPYGASFLMPEDARSNLLMIATGTGIAPMRGMILQRLKREVTGRQALFYGGRTPAELPYCDDLKQLPGGFLDLNLAFSRVADQPKCYVQDLLRSRHEAIAALLRDDNTFIYLCGLKGMEAGVNEAFAAICAQHGMDWQTLSDTLLAQCRLHIETY